MYQDVHDYATNTQTLAADTTYTGASGSNDPTATTAGKSLGLDIKREKQNGICQQLAVYVNPSARRTYPPFPVNKYAGNPGSRHFTFFNGAVVSAAPKIDAPMVSEVSLLIF